jgi:hypothetical protein
MGAGDNGFQRRRGFFLSLVMISLKRQGTA